MGDVIEFLARVGRDASLRRARGDGYDEALERAGFDPSTTRALKARDGDTLRVLMGHGVYFDTQMGEESPSEDEESGNEPDHDDSEPAESPQ